MLKDQNAVKKVEAAQIKSNRTIECRAVVSNGSGSLSIEKIHVAEPKQNEVRVKIKVSSNDFFLIWP